MKNHPSVLPVAWIALRTLIVLNWVYGALIFLFLLISFQAEKWTFQALGVGPIAGHEGIVAGMRSIMVIGIVSVPIAWVFFSRLLRISGNFDPTGWLAILLLFVLAQVFLEGSRMRADLEGTV